MGSGPEGVALTHFARTRAVSNAAMGANGHGQLEDAPALSCA
jgi:hypothetical protein